MICPISLAWVLALAPSWTRLRVRAELHLEPNRVEERIARWFATSTAQVCALKNSAKEEAGSFRSESLRAEKARLKLQPLGRKNGETPKGLGDGSRGLVGVFALDAGGINGGANIEVGGRTLHGRVGVAERSDESGVNPLIGAPVGGAAVDVIPGYD